MTNQADQTTVLQGLLERSNQGNRQARDQLIEFSFERLRRVLRNKMGQGDRISRWEETDDVLQKSVIKLFRSLDDVKPPNIRAYFGLAAEQMRRTLIDIARQYYGKEGLGANYATDQVLEGHKSNPDFQAPAQDNTNDPAKLADWAEFHEQVGKLPQEEREVFELTWYHGLDQEEAAGMLGISDRTLRRHLRAAKLSLHKYLGGIPPNESIQY